MEHTMLLIQPSNKLETRTYSDFESVDECMEGVCKIYEEHLKRTYPNSPSITYDISQLFDFIDKLTDLSCFILDEKHQMYMPRGKHFIKDRIYSMLRGQAGK